MAKTLKAALRDTAPAQEVDYTREDVAEYINAAGRKGSHARAERIDELAEQLGVNRRTVERLSTVGGKQQRGSTRFNYSEKLKEIFGIKTTREFPAHLTVKWSGTVTFSNDTSYRKDRETTFAGGQVEKLILKTETFNARSQSHDEEGEPNHPGNYLLWIWTGGTEGNFSKYGQDTKFEVEG